MSLFIRTDVTSVKLYKNLILAGVGSFLRVYVQQINKLIQKLPSLNAQNIYGIVPSTYTHKLLIFGGKQFTIIRESECMFSCEFEAVVCDDWTHSGIWLPDHKIALLTAHNVVTIWDIKTKSLLSKHISRENSILYSGLLLPLHSEILVFSGTVFSQVILQWCGDDEPLHYLRGHKGVIFSITCNPQKGVIVTTSDDRSVRIWAVKPSLNLDYNSRSYWKDAKIHCIHDLYGHTARVMRNCLTNNYIISVGEDSAICFWDYDGKLLKKSVSHQNACIWSLDADENQLVTGGGDCGVTLHPLSLITDYGHNQIIDVDMIPKKVMFTARRNIVITKEDNNLTYYDINLQRTHKINLNHTSKYQLVCLSFCKQILAAVDMNGKLDIFIENCKGDPELKKIIDTQLDLGKILSLQWAGNRHLVFCSEGGLITIVASKENTTEVIDNFVLPSCKERWLTSSALSENRDVLVAGDRCGHVHIYSRGNKHPAISFKRVHGRYGATSIGIRNNVITTTGRDGTVKYFSIRNTDVKYMSCMDLEFQWVGKFLDVNGNYICGFQERSFVVYDISNNVKMLEVACGGGHRSWDAERYFDKINGNFEEYIRIMYLKNSKIHVSTFCLNKIVSKNIVQGIHSKEINCLKTYTCDADKSVTWYISGGEDTTLRVSRSSLDVDFRDEVIFKHLSNVRSLRILLLEDKRLLVVSAGGRAQICAKAMTFKAHNENQKVSSEEFINYLIKGTDRERKGNQNWKNCSVDFDPETRIMDVEVLARSNCNVLLFAACSDAVLRIFNLKTRDGDFQMLREINYHKTCILKTRTFKFLNEEMLLTCTTRGEVAFWEIRQQLETLKNEPIFVLKANKSGINCVDIKAISDNRFLLATGGDDNEIHLNVIEASDTDIESMKVVHSLVADKFHCSQITGLVLVDSSCVTTSIDQRVTSFSWEVTDDGIQIAFIDQKHSDIADIHGMDIVNSLGDFITVCVFGKGMEVIKMQPQVTAVTEPVWLGEGPHWSHQQQVLYFVSIFDKTIHKYDPATDKHTRAKLADLPGFIIPVEGKKNHFVVGMKRKVVEVEWDGEGEARVVRDVAELDQHSPNNRINDAKADPRGRLFVGTMGYEYEPGKFHLKQGSLYRLEAEGAKRVVEDIDISNGLCWDEAAAAFYYADSFEYAIRRYDYDVDTGEISNPKIIFKYSEHGLSGIVDGMTIDTDGNLWVANFDGSQMLKIDPKKGELLQRVPIPALQTTSAAFGGSGLDALYVTSACMNRGQEQHPPAGATFCVTGLGARGHPASDVRLH